MKRRTRTNAEKKIIRRKLDDDQNRQNNLALAQHQERTKRLREEAEKAAEVEPIDAELVGAE